MNKNWRPKDWDKVFKVRDCETVRGYAAFESGADAMLLELVRLGNSRGGREENEYRKGTWIFIPDEDTDEN